MFILPLAVMCSTTLAADLHVTIKPAHATEPTVITFTDVKPGTLPGLTIPEDNGLTDIFTIRVDLLDPPAVGERQGIFDILVEGLRPKGLHGRLVRETLSKPRIVSLVGMEGMVQQGARRAIPGTDPVQYENLGYSVSLLYTDGP